MIFDNTFENKEPVLYEKGRTLFFDKNIGSTMIDFQLTTNRNIDIGKALKSHTPLDLWEDSIETEEGDYLVDISKMSRGTGTRPAALELRNIVLNLAINRKGKVILNFDGVGTISSSYADELIGKMIAEYGIMFFIKKIDIVGISKLNSNILERSVKQRMAQSYYDEEISDE